MPCPNKYLGCQTGDSRGVYQNNVMLGSMPPLMLLDTKGYPRRIHRHPIRSSDIFNALIILPVYSD